jgi:hypothetical protein
MDGQTDGRTDGWMDGWVTWVDGLHIDLMLLIHFVIRLKHLLIPTH